MHASRVSFKLSGGGRQGCFARAFSAHWRKGERMGAIINPRGTSGSGKTELVRRILADYGWRRDHDVATDGIEPIYRPGKAYPFACRLQHPSGRRPLVVLGHYQVTSGGCDTIRTQDGGLLEAVRLAGEFASRGHDVVMEGLRLSSEVALSARLAAAHGLHILHLSTPVERCAWNLVSRRRAGKNRLQAFERNTAEEHRRVEEACQALRQHATVESLDFDGALAWARELLGLEEVRAAPWRSAAPRMCRRGPRGRRVSPARAAAPGARRHHSHWRRPSCSATGRHARR